ncbi:hypothetical protein FOB51_01480 (plasmid) [Paracoccus yeei]|uniref:Uncharacterized protein n=1 Tax=Paracoccus yeei TaxID=147645 RepID=A0A5P2QMR9_9RHOB|nr:hypothetical protein FOB51_01480 [Paracoccus yeei]
MPPGSSAKAPEWGFFIQPFWGDYGQHSQAIALAAVAVVTMTVAPGRLPLVALGLSLSWGRLRLLQEEPAAWPQPRLHAPGALPLCVGHPAMADADRGVAFGTGSSAALVRLRRSHGRPDDALSQWRQAGSAAHRPRPAMYRADADLFLRGAGLRRAVRPVATDRISAHLGGAGAVPPWVVVAIWCRQAQGHGGRPAAKRTTRAMGYCAF